MRRDGRGRVSSMPPILHYGFRPFFFLAALYAGLALPAWSWMHLTGVAPPGAFPGYEWHAHEMLFGYLGAVVAGFILTAIPNWTGRLPLSGWPLSGLVALWIVGRLACALITQPWLTAALDLAFPAVLAGAVWREVIVGRNWKNGPVALMISLFGIADALHHGANVGFVQDGLGIRLALATIIVLLALIGGRIVPSFTRNWLAKQKDTRLPASFGRFDKTALAITVLSAFLWTALPDMAVTGVALAASGALLAVRALRWHGYRTVREPILFILHVGYMWLAVALLLLGASILGPAIPPTAALHALTAGAIGTMTLAVMTRASLGHTGREIRADPFVVAMYLAVIMGAALRVVAPLALDWYASALALSGILWSAAFLLFAVRYAPILWTRRVSNAG